MSYENGDSKMNFDNIEQIIENAISDHGDTIASAITDAVGTGAGDGSADLLTTLERLGDPIRLVASAITAPAGPGCDATGGTVMSLTEAVMGTTAALCQIAGAIHYLAEAVRESRPH